MARNFPDFITSYQDYAASDAIPPLYNLWTGLTLLSSVAERKVWVVDDSRIAYPNLFTLLVGPPGMGKSQAIGKSEPLVIAIMEATGGNYRRLDGIITQAGLCEEMEITVRDADGSYYSPIFVTGDEGSDSALKNHADDFRATACAMYDCKKLYQKRLKMKSYNIPNPVMNMLMGTTFDFLKTIVNESSVMGGLASRFIYVIDEKEISKESKLDRQSVFYDPAFAAKLAQDLHHIYGLRGKFKFQKEALELHGRWIKTYAEDYNTFESERLKSIHVRRPFLLLKTMQLFSLSQRDDLGITTTHMERAIEAVDKVSKDYAKVITSAIMGNKNLHESTSTFILHAIKDMGGVILSSVLRRKFMNYGGDPSKFEGVMSMMAQAEMIKYESETKIRLLVEPDSNL